MSNIFKDIIKTNVKKGKKVKKDIQIFDDEIKVVDIDLTTLRENDVTKDGYIIDELGNVKRLSDEAILFLRKFFSNSEIAIDRFISKRNYLNDEIKVVDIDLSTIELRNIHKDGYYIDRDGSVKRISDEAILFLRRMFPDQIIAKNRLQTVSTYKEDLISVESLDLSSIQLKNIDMDGYYLNEDSGIVRRLSDEAIVFLRKIYKNNKIAINRVFEDKNVKQEREVKKYFANNASVVAKGKELLTKIKTDTKIKSDALVTGVKNLKTNINGTARLVKNTIIEKKPVFNQKIKDGLLGVKDGLNKIKDSSLEKKESLIKGIKNLVVNLKSKVLSFKKKVTIAKSKIQTSKVKDELADFQKSISKVNIDNLKAKEPLMDRIKNIKLNLSNGLSVLKKKIELSRKPVFARNVSYETPKRVFKEGLRPEHLKKESLSDKISNLKVNLSSKLFDIHNKIEIAKRPKFAKNEFKNKASILREFNAGMRPEKNMGDMDMLERVGTYIKNIGKPSYAIRVQKGNNNVRTFKLVKEPLFKSSYMVSNLKLVGRKLTGLGGAVALTSSMISGITPSMSASTDDVLYDAGAISLFKEIDDNRYTGTIELDDDDSYIKGIILDEHFDKSLDSEDNIYTDDYYDIDPLFYANDDGEGLVAGDYLETEIQKEETAMYIEPTTEKKVDSVSKLQLSYGTEDYISYALYNKPYSEVHSLDENLTMEIIDKYSKIYNVNSSVVYNKIAELTNNFSSDDYINKKTIDGVTCKGKQVYANSYEELLMLAVRSIAQLPDRFSINYNDLHNCSYYVSSEDYALEISHIAKLFNIDRCLVYAIIHTETNFVSDLFIKRNNPAGLMEDAKYRTFSSKEEGFIELCTEIRKYNEKGAYTLEEMAQLHCEGNPRWAPTVREVYNSLKAKEKEIFGESDLVFSKTR